LWWVNGWMQTFILNQILRWLKKPKVVRLVCLVSSVVGLFCYALSSSFNHLLGSWSWWKMLLYILFSSITCLAVLFTPARSSSSSHRLEFHFAFLVLTVTSLYSFLFDNVVKGKPDAYSLISCAAFATMSLGLSNLTQFGFQIDLLYFFCGGLTVQLMKIKLWLVVVGGGFSYSLLQLRDYPSDRQGENLQLQVQNQVIIQVDDSGSVSSSSPVTMSQQANADVESTLGTSPEDGDFRFQDHLLTQSNSPSQDGSVDDVLIIQQQLMNCVKELEKENQRLVPMVCSHVEKYLKVVFDSKEVPHPDVNLVMDALPSGIMGRLKENVKLMVEAGFTEECSDIYSKWRREFLKQCLQALRLQFETPNNEDVEKWLKTCKAAGKILFPNERRLCDYLFSRFSVAAADVSFEKVCKELTINVVNFADTTITTGTYLPNLLFNIVPKMSESLGELIQDFISPALFDKLSFVDDIEDVRQRLATVNRVGNIIYHTTVQAPVTDGGLHLITKEVMKHILGFCDFKLEPAALSYRVRIASFWVVIGKMVELLESELEVKSKDYYADPALGFVFMLNNLNYIAQKTKFLKMDDDWFRRNRAKVQQKRNLYLRRSWNKIVEFLKIGKNESAEADVVAELMKEKLHLFNLHFEETCTTQSTWTVSDMQLKRRIIKSIEEFLLPQYGKFCDRFRVVFGNQAYHYIKFGFLDIQNCLNHLFLLDEEMNRKDKKNI